ncbi:DUF645 family protein [Vibrio cholerae]|nr:DUF645 family protein [Vibrio cholerae]EGR3963959.1 DUF645 family protein [Vibrio cholerae]ELJ8717760.1 DUF645 family protein [Vibrio cholerae]HDL8934232.1 DUF645 family protein [Vibrio cholerae]HDZ9460354.1 DUF645 family protein [Vibrio cholerae]
MSFLFRGFLSRPTYLDRFVFWPPTSQLWALNVCLRDAFA